MKKIIVIFFSLTLLLGTAFPIFALSTEESIVPEVELNMEDTESSAQEFEEVIPSDETTPEGIESQDEVIMLTPKKTMKLESASLKEDEIYAVTYHYIEMLANGAEKEIGTSGIINEVHYGTGLTEKMVKTIKNNVPKNYRWDTGTDNLKVGDAARGEVDVKVYVNASTTERLYAKIIVDGINKGTTLIYEGEPGNGASLSTKYAQDKSICDRIGPNGGECDVHASLNNGVVTFEWIHHTDSSGHNPSRMSKEFPLVTDGIRIKASGFSDGVTVSSQESSTDQYDVHTFTINIDLSKMTNVIVHYVDKEDNEIADPEKLTSYEKEPFDSDDITILEIEGYENPTVGELPDTYPATGSTDVYVVYEKEKKFSVTYTDGVEGEEVFKDQITTDLKRGTKTPGFEGTPEREGYVFNGWTPEVAQEVTEDAIYIAQWTPIQVSITIHYVDADGNQLNPDFTTTIKWGEGFTQHSPTIENYKLVKNEDATICVEAVCDAYEYTVVYEKDESDEPIINPSKPTKPTASTTLVDYHHPITGDGNHIITYIIILVMALAAICFVKKLK